MPDTLLVNTTNTTLKKMWALSSRRSLSRKKKKCIPQIKCNGRRGCISNGPKMENGLEVAFEGSIDIEMQRRRITCDVFHCFQSLNCMTSKSNRLEPESIHISEW